MKKLLSLIVAMLLCVSCIGSSLASSISADGSVESLSTITETAVYGGSIAEVLVNVGDHVSAGDVIAVLDTTKVYAEEDGTASLAGEVGDSTENVANRYGAVVYVEPACRYTISTSTSKAYSAEANRIVHRGEIVLMQSTSVSERTGHGVITQVDGTSYTVEVTDGTLISTDTVYIYRDNEIAGPNRIGRGKLSIQSYTAYNGSGIIARFAVEEGQTVKKGDLLFETVEGEYHGRCEDPSKIVATADGTITSLSVSKGASISSGSTVCEIYPDAERRVIAQVSETDRDAFKAGDTVTIEALYNDNAAIFTGVVERISSVVTSASTSTESSESYYDVVVSSQGMTLPYGSSVTVYTVDEDAEEEPEEAQETEETADEAPAGEMPDMSNLPDMPSGEMPDMSNLPAMPSGEMPDMSNFPEMPAKAE